MQATLNASNSSAMDYPVLGMLRDERNMVGAHILVSLIALTFGIFMGPFQAFHRSPAFVAAFPNRAGISISYRVSRSATVFRALYILPANDCTTNLLCGSGVISCRFNGFNILRYTPSGGLLP
jgi:hypothetical protein